MQMDLTYHLTRTRVDKVGLCGNSVFRTVAPEIFKFSISLSVRFWRLKSREVLLLLRRRSQALPHVCAEGLELRVARTAHISSAVLRDWTLYVKPKVKIVVFLKGDLGRRIWHQDLVLLT